MTDSQLASLSWCQTASGPQDQIPDSSHKLCYDRRSAGQTLMCFSLYSLQTDHTENTTSKNSSIVEWSIKWTVV
jgi:hypothetical protein